MADQLKPLYDFVHHSPDLSHQPIPLVDRKLMKRFVASNHGTIDCGRGCPFNCSFCTIIDVQGRKMRVPPFKGATLDYSPPGSGGG